jgi:hypothetical protein
VGRLFPFVADVVSYLVLLISLLRIRNPLQRERDIVKRHLLAEVREGIRWLWSQPVLRALAFLIGYFYVLMNGSVLIVLVVAQQHQVSPGIIGLIFALGGAGNIIGVPVTVGILWAGLILFSIGMLANARVRGANLPHEE